MLAINTNFKVNAPINMIRLREDVAVEPSCDEYQMTPRAALPLVHATAHPIRPGTELVTVLPAP